MSRSFRVIGLGEILWDLLPDGKKLGGAPANFAYHAYALGADAMPVTRVGDDADGREILDLLANLGLPTRCVQIDADAPTGTVSVEMLPGGQHRFTIHEGVAWDLLRPDEASLAAAQAADAICFGTLGQRCATARSAIQRLVGATPAHCLRIFDINLRQQFYSEEVIVQSLQLANVLKINDQELPVLAEMLALTGTPQAQLAALITRFELTMAALTRGGEGSLLVADGVVSDVPGLPVAVADTIGAGDAFTAAIALGRLSGWELDAINRHANTVAAYVCSQSGATPAIPDRLRIG